MVIEYFLLTERVVKEKVYRVGILSVLRVFDPITDTFKEEMRELGYVEGESYWCSIPWLGYCV